LIADFSSGFKEPEMVKRRPVIVISPKIRLRGGLCTVVALSTLAPTKVMPYHCQLTIDPPLPAPWDQNPKWIKGDMVYALGFHRLDLVRIGKDLSGTRVYRYTTLPNEDLKKARACVLHAMGLSVLTKHLP
jgi:mRNA interferase MazF